MADIKTQISDDVKVAMRSRDKERLAALRLILAAFKQKEVDERIELNNEQSIAILDKMAKQHRDSIEQFGQPNRDDLIEKEQQEDMAFVDSLLNMMTLAEKVGQMTQIDHRLMNEIDDNSKFHLGSLLAGGGGGPPPRSCRLTQRAHPPGPSLAVANHAASTTVTLT